MTSGQTHALFSSCASLWPYVAVYCSVIKQRTPLALLTHASAKSTFFAYDAGKDVFDIERTRLTVYQEVSDDMVQASQKVPSLEQDVEQNSVSYAVADLDITKYVASGPKTSQEHILT